MKNQNNFNNLFLVNKNRSLVNKSKNNFNNSIDRIIGLGLIDLEFTLTLTEIEIKLFKIKYESITTLEGIQKLFENHSELLDLIILSSNNSLITSLLYLNKISNKKCFIEFLSYNKIYYTLKEKFMEYVIKYVTEHNFIFISENNLSPIKSKICFNIKYENYEKIKFIISNENENEILEEEYENIMNKIPTDFSEFHFFFLDLNDNFYIQNILNDPSQDNILNLSNTSKFLKEIYNKNKHLKFIINFPNIISNTNLLNIENIESIQEIFKYSDIIIFDKKEAFAYYKIQYELNETEENIQSEFDKISNKILEQFFIKEIKFKIKEKSQTKTILYLDDLNKILILEKNTENKFLYNNEYKLEIHPKLTHFNLKLINEYKKHIAINYNILRAIFIGGFISKQIIGKSYNESFLVGQEITKRILELFKTKTELFLNSEFYITNLKKTEIEKKLGIHVLRENEFILDCVNPIKSKLRNYDPILDKSLNFYFSNGKVLKNLINSKVYENNSKFLTNRSKSQVNKTSKSFKNNNNFNNNSVKLPNLNF